MSSGKTPQQQPTIAGLDWIDYSTNETDLPHTYFAGAQKLPVSWIMTPIITMTKPASNGGKGK